MKATSGQVQAASVFLVLFKMASQSWGKPIRTPFIFVVCLLLFFVVFFFFFFLGGGGCLIAFLFVCLEFLSVRF